MKSFVKIGLCFALSLSCLFVGNVLADSDKEDSEHKISCDIAGPQTPRDIDNPAGLNKSFFSYAPSYKEMNLCNIHFHKNAEHKAAAFSINAGDNAEGHAQGYQCNASTSLSKAELKMPDSSVCEGIKPGDTIEVHWVYSSCNIKPGEGLGACSSESCINPSLRVETQVFTVVNDRNALNFEDYDYDGGVVNGYHQAKALPKSTGNPVQFLGSTTGKSYSESSCSPLQVSWSVRPQCAKVDINSLGKWCKNNAFNEDHAHRVRRLVTNPKFLAPIH